MTQVSRDELWCVNITGPDDVIAVASREEAITLSARFNTWWIESIAAKGLHPYDPTMWAVPINWPHSAEGHAENLGDFGEYGWLRAIPSPTAEGEAGVTVQFIPREDGGLNVSSPDLPGLILSGADASAVASAIPTAINALSSAPMFTAPVPAAGRAAVAWMGYWPGAGSVDSVTRTTHFKSTADKWREDGAEVTPLAALVSEGK